MIYFISPVKPEDAHPSFADVPYTTTKRLGRERYHWQIEPASTPNAFNRLIDNQVPGIYTWDGKSGWYFWHDQLDGFVRRQKGTAFFEPDEHFEAKFWADAPAQVKAFQVNKLTELLNV